MGIIESIKEEAKRTGFNRDRFIFIKEDEKVRVRFLEELDEGHEYWFHDSFENGVPLTICRKHFGEKCPLCNKEGITTRKQYLWSVYNYDSNNVDLLMFKVSRVSPVQTLVEYYEEFGTILGRDYTIKRTGKQLDTRYTVTPLDKSEPRNKALPYSESTLLEMLNKAYPVSLESKKKVSNDDDEDDNETLEDVLDDDNIETLKTSKKGSKSKSESHKYASMEGDEAELPGTTVKKTKKESKYLSVKSMETLLEKHDIDMDDFLEYFELTKLKDIKETKKGFMEYIEEYIEWVEGDE